MLCQALTEAQVKISGNVDASDSAEHFSELYSDQNLVNACNAWGNAWHCLALPSTLSIAQDHCVQQCATIAWPFWAIQHHLPLFPQCFLNLLLMLMHFFPGVKKSYKLPLCAYVWWSNSAYIFLLCWPILVKKRAMSTYVKNILTANRLTTQSLWCHLI